MDMSQGLESLFSPILMGIGLFKAGIEIAQTDEFIVYLYYKTS